MSEKILLDKIHVDQDFNCRGAIAPMDVIGLANDIEEHGLLQPVVVMEHNEEEVVRFEKPYCLIAGFRRTSAYRLKGWTEIPAVVQPWMSEQRRKIINLSENIQREDLNILEEAKALAHLHSLGVPRESVAKRLGKSGKWVQIRYYLLDLPPEIQQEASAGILNQYQIGELRKMKDPQKQFEAVKMIKEAKVKGQAAPEINEKKRPTKGAKRQRTRAQIQERMVTLVNLRINPGFWSRCLAWASAEISDIEFFKSAREYAKERDIPFTIPAKFQED